MDVRKSDLGTGGEASRAHRGIRYRAVLSGVQLWRDGSEIRQPNSGGRKVGRLFLLNVPIADSRLCCESHLADVGAVKTTGELAIVSLLSGQGEHGFKLKYRLGKHRPKKVDL